MEWVTWGLIAYAVWQINREGLEASDRHRQQMAALDRIEAELRLFHDHPLNTQYIVDGLEGLIEEHRDRVRQRGVYEP